MKLYNIITLSFVSALFLLNSCTEEDLIKGNSGNGKPVTVFLPFQIEQSEKIQTRAIDKDPEFLVYDLYLYVFDEVGNIISRKYYENEGDDFTYDSQKEIGKEDGSTSGTLKIELTTGDRYILAVANPTSTSSGADILTQLNNANNQTELGAVITDMQNKTIDRIDGRFLMSGYYKATATSTDKGKCNITTNTTKLPGKIWLDRVDAKVQFIVSCGKEGATFTPMGWQVVNVPTKSYLFGNNSDVIGCTYFSSAENSTFNPYTIDGKNREGFLFYMQESLKRAGTLPPSYAARDEENKDANGLNTSFKYAPENATYIILKGKYTGKGTFEEGGKIVEKDVEANVRYVIHLGNTNNNDFANYQTLRNTHYLYKVTVMGVNDIIVEVEQSREERPGAEGDVIMKDGDNLITLDAHYETKVLTFNKSTIQAAENSNIQFAYIVKTPFTGNTNILSTNDPENARNNAEWVRFVRSTEKDRNGNYNSNLAVYPGNDGENLLTIDELLQELESFKRDNSQFDNSGNVKYTCFIDEYYYDKEPGKSTTDLTLWKKFVNQPNRNIYILCDIKESTDKESTVTKAAYVLSQRAIQTFYNTHAPELKTAWGVELKQETPDVPRYNNTTANYGYGNNEEYGRKNIATRILTTPWSTVLDLTKEHTLQSSYTYSYAACMSRNRDVSGDGKISHDEVQWYLPTLNQYTAMFIGEYGMDTDARMYYEERNKVIWEYKHFISSFKNWILWAEEGASTGYSENTHVSSKKFKHRCARNLGIGREDNSTDPQNYLQYNSNVFTLTYLNQNSLRQDKINEGELQFHGTFEEGNKLFKKFRIAQSKLSGAYTWNGVNAMAKSPCDTYEEGGIIHWRLPNLNELALMGGKGLLDGAAIASRTYFQYQNMAIADMPALSKEGRRGHAWNGSMMYLFNKWSIGNTTYDITVPDYGINWGGERYKWEYNEYTKGSYNTSITEVSNASSKPDDFEDRYGQWESGSIYPHAQNGTVTVTRKNNNPDKNAVDIGVSLRCVKDMD